VCAALAGAGCSESARMADFERRLTDPRRDPVRDDGYRSFNGRIEVQRDAVDTKGNGHEGSFRSPHVSIASAVKGGIWYVRICRLESKEVGPQRLRPERSTEFTTRAQGRG